MSELVRTIGNSGVAKEKQLGQLKPADTDAASLYSPASKVISTDVKSIFVTNLDSSAHAFSIYHDDDGTTYDDSTCLYDGVSISGTSTTVLEGRLFMGNTAGNLAVKTDSANNINFTAYGIEIQKEA